MRLFKLLLTGFVMLILSLPAASQTAGFTVDTTEGCGTLTPNFYNTSQNYDSVKWIFGINNITLTEKYPTSDTVGTTYTPGTYVATLVAYKGTLTDSSKVTIHVYNPPVADFSVDKTMACLPDTAHFTDSSQKGDGTITNWTWDFKDGNTSNLQNPQKIYSIAGQYSVFLRVTDSHGCQSSVNKSNYIDVAAKPTVSFTASPNGGCSIPLAVQFTNNSSGTGSLTYSWDFGNGSVSSQKDPQITYNSLGDYTVKLIVNATNYGCSSSLSVPKAVSIGQAQAIGTLKQNGITIQDNDTICAGVIDFHSSSAGAASVLWSFGDSNFSSDTSGSHQYISAGNYTVLLIASSGGVCVDTARWNFTVEKATAEFTESPDQSCSSAPDAVTFTDQSVNANTYLWTFYDGSTSTVQNPVFIFTPSGNADPYALHGAQTYTTMLTVKSKHNCASTAQHTFTIQRPTALFSVDTVQGCVPLTVKFTDRSLSNQSISFYNWQFGDGNQTSLSYTHDTVSHTFTNAGVFQTRLIIKNALNCEDTSYTITVKAGKKPTPDFSVTPASICANSVVQFTDLTPATDSLDYWQYSVNGQSLPVIPMQASPSLKIHADTGSLKVILLAGSRGCYASANKTITNSGPVDSIRYSFDCALPLTYNFKAVALGVTSYKWDFGDGSTDNSTLTPVHSYSTPGDRTVTFIGTGNSCSDTVTLVVKVRNSAASFTSVSYACAGSTLRFKASTASADGECRDKYLWDFGDSTAAVWSESDTIFHSFPDRKKYKVLLTSIFDNGCSDTVSKSINILKPLAKFKADVLSGCTPLSVTFTDQSTYAENPISEWDWISSNGQTLSSTFSGNTFTAYFDNPGTYNVLLTTTDTMHCVDTTSMNISAANPSANFSADNTSFCSNTPVNLYYYYSNPDSVLWDFGDGTTSKDLTNPIQHLYNPADTSQKYTVSLTVYKYGCSSPAFTIPDYLYVQKVNAAFSVSDSAYDCYPAQITFTHLFPGDVVNGSWDFGDQSGTTPYQVSPSHFYQKPGDYTAKLVVSTLAGCTDSTTKVIKISGPTGGFDVSDTVVCKSDSITLTLKNATNLSSYVWDLGDGRLATGTPYTYKYSSVGSKLVSLVLHGANSCNPPAQTQTIDVQNVTASFLASDTTMCDSTNVVFTNQSSGNDIQSWDLGDGTTSTEANPQHVYATGTYVVKLYVANTAGCKDTARQNLTVNPYPGLILNYNKQNCAQNQAILVASTNASSIVWTPAAGLNASNTGTVVAAPSRTTLYTVKVTNDFNCSRSDSVTVYRPYVDLLPRDTSVIIGHLVPVSLIDSSGIAYFTWVPQTGLSCVNCLNPEITPKDTFTIYRLIMKEPAGCFTDTVSLVIHMYDPLTFAMPSAFRPGHGDVNSYFGPLGTFVKVIDFKIYNRWGNLVFSSTDASAKWDGTYNGKDQPIDSYIYTITVQMSDGQIRTKKGTVLLVR